MEMKKFGLGIIVIYVGILKNLYGIFVMFIY